MFIVLQITVDVQCITYQGWTTWKKFKLSIIEKEEEIQLLIYIYIYAIEYGWKMFWCTLQLSIEIDWIHDCLWV